MNLLPFETLPINYALVISATIFAIGLLGVVIRKNTIIIFMCIELMLNATNISLVAFSKLHGDIAGQMTVFFVMVIAAAEAAVGLALIISLFRLTKSVDRV